MSSSTHPPDGDLRALLDGELADAQRQTVVRHSAECAICHDRLLELERAVDATDELLGFLAPPASALSLSDVTRRAARVGRRRSWLIAASITLAVAATAGATVGRPFMRALATRVLRGLRPSVPAREGASAQGELAIGLAPGSLTEIQFAAAQQVGVLRVSLADTTDLVVRSTGAVPYRVFPGGVMVQNGVGSASYDIVLPRSAPHVRILVAGRLVLEKTGSDIVTAIVPDTAGRYVLKVR